jgi:hypothetical protein
MQWYLKILNKSLFLIALILSMQPGCSGSQTYHYGQGEIFRNLAYHEGRGTIIIFYVDGDELSDKVRLDIGIISESYGPQIRIFLIDVIKKRNLSEKHRVEQVPTVILFDNMGAEVYRWLPWDFRSDFSPRDIERKIEKLPPPLNQKN